jgi:hypothetical protein
MSISYYSYMLPYALGCLIIGLVIQPFNWLLPERRMHLLLRVLFVMIVMLIAYLYIQRY